MATTSMASQIAEVFDEEADMQDVDEVAWKKIKEARIKDGYADGKHLGRESTLQSGFYHGYYEGFELGHSLSVIQGLLAVVHLHICRSHPELLNRWREIKSKLDDFEKSVRNLKLYYLKGDQPVNNDDDDLLDCSDENCNAFSIENTSDGPKCYFSALNAKMKIKEDDENVKSILEEFGKLKTEISLFLSDCNQPNIKDQVSLSMYFKIFETIEFLKDGKFSMSHDLALVKLSAPVLMNPHIQAVCLPQLNEELKVGEKCFASGWGITRGSGSADVLKQAEHPIRNETACNNIFQAFEKENMVCAGHAERLHGLCHGDSGGPLVCRKNGTWHVYGAASFVTDSIFVQGLCGLPNQPTVFGKISPKVNWIRSTISENS